MMPAVHENKWLTLVAVCIATFMLLLDITIVNVALPELKEDLGASFTDLQWVVDAYALALAAFLLLAGSLADRIGRRRVFAWGLVLFVAASIGCGFSESPTVLNLFRALQGIGGSAMFATSLALIAGAFHGADRATAIGAWGATIGGAVAIGPLVGGLCTEHLGWESIFFLNVPIGVLAVFVTLRYVAESTQPGARRIDWPGAATFSAALFLLVFALVRGNAEGWGSGIILACLAWSVALLLVWLVVELRVEDPTFDLSLFRNRSFNGVSVAAFGLSASMFAMFLYQTLFIQNQLGYGPLDAGLRFLPTTLVSFFVAPIAARLTQRYPARVFFGLGLGLVGIGLLLMRNVGPDSDWTALLPGFVVAGVGVGCANPIIASVAVAVVEPREAGMASGISGTFRQVGIATGIAALGAVFQSRLAAGVPGDAPNEGAFLASVPLKKVPPELRDAVHAGFVGAFDDILLIAALVALASAVAAVALVRSDAAAH
jgi:EmrB/QacA subfamily drug resistance transporter